jgi:hypothetical protein
LQALAAWGIISKVATDADRRRLELELELAKLCRRRAADLPARLPSCPPASRHAFHAAHGFVTGQAV